MSDLVLALSAVPGWVVERWWKVKPRYFSHVFRSFSHVFRSFVRSLEGGLVFADCDPVANFALVAVTLTRDQDPQVELVLGQAILNERGLEHVDRLLVAGM